MKFPNHLWLLIIFALNANVFGQDMEELRLFSEANKTRFISPEKSLKLYDYLLKNSDSKIFSIEIQIQKLQIDRFVGEYKSAIEKSNFIQKELKTTFDSRLDFLYHLEQSKLYHEVELLEQSSSAYEKANRIYNTLPVDISQKYKADLELAKNYVFDDFPAEKKFIGLQKIIEKIPVTDERLSWLRYRFLQLYLTLDQEEKEIYKDHILGIEEFNIFSCVLKTKPCDPNELQEIFNDNLLPPELKLTILNHNLMIWDNTNQTDSISKSRIYLQEFSNKLEIEKKHGKIDLLQNIFEAKEYKSFAEDKLRKNKLFLWNIFLLLILLIYFGILFNKNYKKRNSQKSEENEESTSKSIVIPDKTEIEILEKLKKFETSNLFLDKQLRIASLAKKLDTNTRYLSMIINASKDKSFNNYINSLRINYILKKLSSDPKYLTYKISYLAEQCGFASQSSFTSAFKEITGETPSAYIKTLEAKQ